MLRRSAIAGMLASMAAGRAHADCGEQERRRLLKFGEWVAPAAEACGSGGGGGSGPAASSTFVTAEFATPVNMPGGGQVTIPRELFGIAAAAPADNDFSILTNSTFQATSSTLSIPLVRFNCNSGLATTWSNTFPSGPTGTPNFSPWTNFVNNIGKCVNLATTKIIIGVGFPGTNGESDANFANMASQVVRYLATAAPGGGACPINPLYWEYLNEQGSVTSSGFNAFVNAINAVGPGYTCLAPTAANNFGQLNTIISGIGSLTFEPDEHAYLYCAGSDPQPSDAQMAQAQTAGSGTTPAQFASSINSACDGHIPGTVPFFWGEWNLECSAANLPEEQNNIGALFAASNLFKCAAGINRPLWGGIWEWANDTTYGIIQGNTTIAPVGYYLSHATQKMPGKMISTTLNGTNAPNMNGWSTSGSGTFGVTLINWDTVAHAGQVALSHWPVNTTGNGTATVWTQSGTTPAGGTTTQATVTAGLTSSISVPSFGQVVISVP